MSALGRPRLFAAIQWAVVAVGLLSATGGALALLERAGVIAPQLDVPVRRALVFLLAGGSLALWEGTRQGVWTRVLARAGGVAVVLLGLAGLGGALLGTLDTAATPTWMAILWRGLLVCPLIGMALTLFDVETARGRLPAQPLAAMASGFAAIELVAAFYAMGSLDARLALSLPAGLLHALLAVAVLVARPQRGAVRLLASRGPGGQVARRLLPVALVVPALLGWFLVAGRQSAVFSVEMGTALLTVITSAVGVALVLWRAASLDRDELERRRAQQALRASEERFRGLVENSADGFLLVSRDGAVLYQSPSVARVLGYIAGERVGQNALDIVHPDDLPVARNALAESLANQARPISTQFRVRHKDGRWVWVEGVVVNRLETPAIRALVVNYRDVTERRTMEERLRRSETRNRAILDGALDAVVGMDLDGRVTYWNPRAEALFGWPRAEAVGRPLRDLIIPERHRAGHSQGLERMARTGETRVVGRRIEIEALRRDGTEFPVELTIAALATEESLEFNAFVSDISERRKLEEQLRQSQKMEAVGLLAGGVAHDFNNLLNVILGYGEMLLRDIEADDPRRRRLEQICRAADRAAALTRQLLAFSRKQVLQPRVLDLNDVVSDVESMLRRLIGADVELVSVKGADPARVKVDPGQIEQVIVNLAVNARDAMPGGGRLALETRREILDTDFVQNHPGAVPGRYIALVVTDSGQGMDAETQARVFEPFFTTKERGKGTGLGLSTVYGIVKQSGGYISISSEPGRGSTFRVYLPETDESPTPAVAPDRAGRASSVTETVLVAEDEPALRDLIQEILEAEGYVVLACGNGDEALRVAERRSGDIHLLLTDVVMPDMTGPDLARRLAGTRPGLKTLFISGYAQAASTRQGVLPVGVPFLAKPFAPDLLVRRVREVLENGREQG